MTLYQPVKTASKFMKGLIIKTNKKASYNMGNSSNDVSINIGKYASLIESWVDQQPFFDTSNKHTSENNSSFHSRSYSFIYIPSLGKPHACIQPQENDCDYGVVKYEQCNVPAEQFANQTSSDDVSINIGKYASLIESWVDRLPFFGTNNKYTSENNSSFHSRSYSFTYIPSPLELTCQDTKECNHYVNDYHSNSTIQIIGDQVETNAV